MTDGLSGLLVTHADGIQTRGSAIHPRLSVCLSVFMHDITKTDHGSWYHQT